MPFLCEGARFVSGPGSFPVSRIMAQLEFNSGDRSPVLLGERVVLGRSPDEADVVIDDKRLSRRHCEIRREGETFAVEDLASRNGTQVNGVVVTVAALKEGDELSLGGFILRFKSVDTPSALGQAPAEADSTPQSAPAADAASLTRQTIGALRDEICKAVVGKVEVVDLLLTAVLAGGHILIEDLPGLGKTTLARALAKALRASFARVQFTPDLLPADIIGTSVYNQINGEFSWRQGPIFNNVVLADEINRATPRTQSALLEAMSEGQVSADGITHVLPDPFIVIATQNPIEHAGTYPLPESQLDRFMLRLAMGYPAADDERAILGRFAGRNPLESVAPVVDAETLRRAKRVVRSVRVDDAVKDYILAIVSETRANPRLIAGASPRGSLALCVAAQSYAVIKGRNYVIPDDIKALAVAVLSHRVIERASMDGRGGMMPGQSTITRILDKVPVPV